jgi:hypothetical protein
MSTADLQSASLARGSNAAVARPAPRGRLLRRVVRIIGGFFLTGIFLALSGPTFALCAVYGFVWFAQHH